MPTHLEPFDAHAQRKHQLKNRMTCARMGIIDQAYKLVTPTSLVFNLSLEPAHIYTLATFGDKGEDLLQRTCQKLQDHTLYIETDSQRFEISKFN